MKTNKGDGRRNYMIRIALENVVTTKGSTSQNHGLRSGIISITVITAADIKKYNHHLPVPSVVFI
jgi:hypothetical protein